MPSAISKNQRTVREKDKVTVILPSSQKVLRRRSSLDLQNENTLSIYEREHKVQRNTERRHSVCIVPTRENSLISKGTQTNSSVSSNKPSRTKSVVSTSKSKVELRPILKFTGGSDTSVSERVKAEVCSVSEHKSDSVTSAISDVKFCYRLPEKKPAKLRKTVSFSEDTHRIKVRDYSRTYSPPVVPWSDDTFNMDIMEETLGNTV